MAKRVQSPSSINTFKQCQRKYYYQYIEKIPTGSSIHQVRGNIAHSTLEHFYDIDVSQFHEDNYRAKFRHAIQLLLLQEWKNYETKLQELKLSEDKLKFYFEETMLMVMNWFKHFIKEFKEEYEKQGSIQSAFELLKPIRELEYRSESHSVRGFIDAIAHKNGEVHIIDYKTNSRSQIKDSIRLQLAIYALMYKEKHNVMPDKLGVFFLRDRLKVIDATQEMIEKAKAEIELIHAHTETTEAILDYKRNITPLCKWRTGQCDFYEICKPHSSS